MNKSIISLLLVLLLFFSLSSLAFASTDISKIEPDTYYGSIIIIGPTEYHDPNAYFIHRDVKTGTTILYPIYVPPVTEQSTNVNQITNNDAQTTTTEDNTPAEGSYAPTKLAEEIFILTNQARMEAEVNTVSYNNKALQESADLRAKEIAEKFSHDRPDGTTCFTAFPNDTEIRGENIIMSDKPIATAKQMMQSWMESEGHRYNILLPDFTQMSVGIYEKDGVVYAAQLFIG
jgi:uncharacterized protein YkwD